VLFRSRAYKRYSTQTKTLVGTIPLVAGGEGLAWDGRSLWSKQIGNSALVEIDPLTGALRSSTNFNMLQFTHGGLTFDGVDFWIVQRPYFVKLNPANPTVVLDAITEFNLPGIEEGLSFDGRYLYAISYTDASDPRLWKIDPVSHTLQPDSFALPTGTYNGLGFDGTSLWAINWSDQTAYKISVPADPKTLLSQLVTDVISLNLQNGISNSFDAKLDAAMAALDDRQVQNDQAAINAMYAFVNAVNAQRGVRLTNAQADSLVSSAKRIIKVLGG